MQRSRRKNRKEGRKEGEGQRGEGQRGRGTKGRGTKGERDKGGEGQRGRGTKGERDKGGEEQGEGEGEVGRGEDVPSPVLIPWGLPKYPIAHASHLSPMCPSRHPTHTTLLPPSPSSQLDANCASGVTPGHGQGLEGEGRNED